MVLLSMIGSLKVTLPRSGFVQQGIQTENLQLAVFRTSNILANYNFPLIAALCVFDVRHITHLRNF